MSIKNLTILITSVFAIFAILWWRWTPSSSQRSSEVQISQPASDIALVQPSSKAIALPSLSADHELPKEVDLVHQLFDPRSEPLEIVETVHYVARVPWLPEKTAYISDWARYYETSKHFISRSLKGKENYLNEAVSRGEKFNVFRKDKLIEFHMVVDLSRRKMWLYYFDVKENVRKLLKSYQVSVGKLDAQSVSGCLTPTGVFACGSGIACYKEGDIGLYKNQPCEMITVFGKRWVPLAREIANCSGSCKGLGIHGVALKKNLETGEWVEDEECIGGYNSLGCIRLLTKDIQELFSIIVSKPSYVHIVRDFQLAELPGVE